MGEETVGAALREGVPLVIGRASPADLVLADPSLSRLHARVTWQGEDVWIEDLGSTNGVLIRGERVSRAAIGPDSAIGRVPRAVGVAGA